MSGWLTRGSKAAKPLSAPRSRSVWVKAGGPLKAYVEAVPVEVTDGKIKVTFTPKVENPQICAIEILPQSIGQPDTR